MYKKIVLIVSALIVLSLPYQQQHAQAVILSKVATTGAKKAVKEVVKDIAIESAVNFAFGEAYKIVNEGERAKYKLQAEYELFCGKKMPDLITCEKPMQIKGELTDFDKVALGNQAEIEFDKLITDGKGFTRWQKFLDWFLPIWVLSFATTALTYALDPEVRSLFNEAGYNALVALGLIKPVTDLTQNVPFESVQLTEPTTNGDTKKDGVTETSSRFDLMGYNSNTLTTVLNFPTDIKYTESVVQVRWNYAYAHSIAFRHFGNIIGELQFGGNQTTYRTAGTSFASSSANTTIDIKLNGTVVEQNLSPVSNGTNYDFTSSNSSLNIAIKKAISIRYRLPYEMNGMFYTDVLVFTTAGDTIQFQVESPRNTFASNARQAVTTVNYTVDSKWDTRITVFNDVSQFKKILVPTMEEIPDPMSPSNYEKDGNIAIIPPSALPYTQTSTGTTLEPKKIGEEIVFQTPEGTTVPEEDITVGDPVVTPSPDGTPQVQPPPTPSNPTPAPIPLTPTQPTPPPTETPPKTPVETEAPVFPEGESCSEGLKLPKIKPLTQTVITAFPFSIPFDLYKGFQSLFSEIGTEKPSFNLVIGDKIDWEITIPDYFDSWKTFTDGILIFVFDVGLIYAIYRFMSGGGS